MSDKELAGIPTAKLEKIHYTQLKILEERRKTGKIEGRQVKIKSIADLGKLKTLLDGVFKDVGQYQTKDQDMLGLHYYIAICNNLPIGKLEQLERRFCQELKKRREIHRQKLDAGNIEKAVREECRK